MKGIRLLMSVPFLFACAIFVTVFESACARKEKFPGPPRNLRCEYRSNPLGIDCEKPGFSWVVNDRRRGAVQSAYQILVASHEDILHKDQGDIWDSGKIESNESAHVKYGGPPLRSRKRYFWKVRTWDGDGVVSPFSDISWWEMGLLEPRDWHASWIGKRMEKSADQKKSWPWGYWIWHPSETGIDVPVYFRKTFHLSGRKRIREAQVRATADNYFTLFMNGKEVGGGEEYTKVYEFEVRDLLQAGKNIVALRAANNKGEVCGLLFSLKITFADGSEEIINADSRGKGWKTSGVHEKNWEASFFDDSMWSRVKVIEKYGGEQWGRIDPADAYQPPRSVLLRNEFSIEKPVKKARVYVTGLGGYVLYLNGRRVGNDLFTPGWTHYPARIQYQIYDVTALIRRGRNAAGAILGNLWWSGGLGWRGSSVYSSGPLRFLFELVLEYEDGSSKRILSDKTWKTHDSPIVSNSLYDGETYDARLEQPGWNQPGFDDSGWQSVSIFKEAQAKLVAQQAPTLQKTDELKPIQVTEPRSGVYIFDFGQNMAGIARLRVKGKSGARVVMRFGEELNSDGTLYTDNLRGAKATDTYILRGGGEENWEPKFTYHGFRYVEVSGYPGKPSRAAVTAVIFHSNSPVIGHFTCSNKLLNRIQHNITWGLRSNLYSVPTDCPQRDERLGWMGDAQIIAPTACYNREMSGFYRKWMRDVLDCQDENGAVHDVSPTIVVGGPAKPGWGDAVVIIPWIVYLFSGDKQIITENFDGMVKWVRYMEGKSKGYLYQTDGYGDWVAVEPSPKEPIAAAYFYYSTSLVAKMAAVIGRKKEAREFRLLAEKIAEAYNQNYFNLKQFQYVGNTQTANLLPVAFGITPDTLRDEVIASVAEDVIRHQTHLTTGFLGTSYLLPMLSRYGKHELAYQLASQRSYPSWGYMVEKGATTIWELWNSDTAGPEMNSRNHYALGSVGEWYFGYLAGIQPDPELPGFQHTILAPRPAGDLTSAEANLQTLYGQLKCRWEKVKNEFHLHILLPANTSARVKIPIKNRIRTVIREGKIILVEKGKTIATSDGVTFLAFRKNTALFEVGSGNYHFTITPIK